MSRPGGAGVRLAEIVDALCHGDPALLPTAKQSACQQPLPSRAAVIELTEALRALLFPGYFGESDLSPETTRFHLGALLDRVSRGLEVQVRRGLCFSCAGAGALGPCGDRVERIVTAFLERLPAVQRAAANDVRAAFAGDPALSTPDEAIFCYPGVQAVACYRLAHELHRLEVPLLPRMITEYAHSQTGIDIHPGATIGEHFFIDHGTGVVIGETCVIGERVRIYQGVTLGAKSFPLDEQGRPIKGIARHPIVEDDVTIYAGATVLGRITIGRGAVIGGNVWLTRSVPPGGRVLQAHAREERFDSGAGI